MRRGFRFSAFRLGRRVAPRGAWAPLGLASAVAGATWERRCRCDDEKWWTDPAQCSDACALWQRTWNGDWDGRGPPPGEKMKATGKIRHLILVRHGQYDLEGEERGLTDLGRRQSEKLAQRLSAERQLTKKDRYGEVRIQYAGIWVSNVTRAIQTAQILAAHLPDVPLMEPDVLLSEGKPTQPHPSSSASRLADLWEDSARMEAGFRKYVHREVDHKRLAEKEKKKKKEQESKLGDGYVPEATPEAHREEKETPKEVKEPKEPEHVYEIYVCHMNLIRYFVMRALQLPPEAWLRLRGDNTNITERVSLHRFGDIGHLPLDMVTFH
ncbi:Serine/threonine-protein phosphatase PGAM5 [Durusdinium trenchii]|uniref:Serine/threonine-protein phosphatase PGAM5, mitochondrial n=1 Tax=Durusdinium trenchii TaxID=1381693 RepID=A0ABP0HX47_9DINO